MRLLTALALLLAGCGSSAPRPDDMSAAAHRGEADRERVVAREQMAADHTAAHPELGVTPRPEIGRSPWTEPHPEADKQAGSPLLHSAEEHFGHAREHERAAEELERFEDSACSAIAPEARPSCPLLHDVTGIEDVPGGVRVRFADGVAVAGVVARIRCHLAYARARGYAGADDCPLYVRGVAASADGDHAIQLRATERELTRRIRALSRAQAVPAR
jgi:hypothetical protein